MAKSTQSTCSVSKGSDEVDDYLLVGAMDFGTTFSGYAFSFKDSPEKILTNSSWVAGSRALMSLKTPTCVLVTPQKEFHSFGYEAENKYVELTINKAHRKRYFFKHFKMLLHNNQCLSRKTMIEDVRGKALQALTVFKMSIEYLKDHMMDCLRQKIDGISQDDIKFVITVPAIWDDTAKQFMREAASKAGVDGDKLKLALEPEAASICCQDVPMIRTTEQSSQAKLEISKAGTQYMVVDLGGGTADITVHEKNIDGTLKELHAASGGAWGGTAVDKNFLKLLSDILGKEVMDRFAKDETEDFLDLMREFETKKRTIQPDAIAQITFKVPVILKEMYEESGQTIQSAVAASAYKECVKWIGDKMRLDADVVKGLFYGPIDNIVSHIKQLFKQIKLNRVSTMVLVGGFSECSLVQKKIKEEFSEKRVIVPAECGLAVLKGAVLFGHRRKVVTVRIARYTYGDETQRRFNPLIHKPEYRTISHGKERCRKIFSKYVTIGDEIHLGHTVSKIARPAEFKQRRIHNYVYASTTANPTYVTEDSCRLLGDMVVPLADADTREEKAIESTMVFGDTELQYTGKQIKSGKTFHKYFDLPTD